jgi:hypothetical protein
MTCQAIPVAMAQEIADGFAKDIVILLAWDKSSNTVGLVTWGRSPEQKEAAATVGDAIFAMVCADESLVTTHEDFRREGEAAAKVDLLTRAIQTAVRSIRGEMHDQTQDPHDTLFKIDLCVDELAAVLPTKGDKL